MEHRINRGLAVTARAALARGQGTLGQGWRRFRATPYGSWLAYLRAKKWLFVALLVGLWMLHLPLPEGLSQAGLIVLTMSVVATILFVTEPIPLPAVALLIVVGQVLLLGLDSSEVARSLMSDSVLFIMGSLMIAVAVVKQKLEA
jgi:sodium-dependent dicarboxylate transporter 2/3/5